MTPLEALLVLLAGVWAGAINTLVGSGSLVTFPVLLAVGYLGRVAEAERAAARRDALADPVGPRQGVGVAGPGGLRGALDPRRGLGRRDLRADVAGQVVGQRQVEEPLGRRLDQPRALERRDRRGAVPEPQP